MSINSLTKIMPPPVNPVDSGAGMQWPSIDKGIEFPQDYVDFINNYGTGRIGEFLLIFNPFSGKEDLNFFEQFNMVLEDLRYLIESDSEYYNYPLYPTEGGLIPFGVTDNGDYLFWVFDSKKISNLWKVAIVAARSPEIEYLPWGMLEFIKEIATGEFKPNSFPKNTDFNNLGFSPV